MTPVAKIREFAEELQRTNGCNEYDGLRRIAGVFPNIASVPIIVLIDQFEEVYSHCRDPEERDAFVGNLLHAASTRAAHVSIVLTLQSDFLDQTQSHSALNQPIANQGIIVPAMTEEELWMAITEPAGRAGYPIEMLQRIGGVGGALVDEAQRPLMPDVNFASARTKRHKS